LEDKVKNLGLANRVQFAGTVSYSELGKYFQKANVFVMPSIRDERGNIDASPVTLMIAMMTGCPIVATKFALGFNDISEDVGYVVKDRDSQAITKAVILLLQKGVNQITRTKIRNFAIENFSVEESAKKYTTIFQKAVHPSDISRAPKGR
jgi:glycosyltransferase involved in cell wall biosynthesis